MNTLEPRDTDSSKAGNFADTKKHPDIIHTASRALEWIGFPATPPR